MGNGNSENVNIICESYNCKGFKQSAEYIVKRLKSVDILCLSETWLRPGELNLVNEVLEHVDWATFTVFSKSGMNEVDSEYQGRPFGGVSIICKNKRKCSYFEIETDNPRIITVGVRNVSGALKCVVSDVYMPYYKTSNNRFQTDEYIECLDVLQSVIDKYASVCPVKVLGDFNAQLPRSRQLGRHWHKAKGFNAHSLLLYDFIVSNSLCTIDLEYDQSVHYTYFCLKRNIFTWIDHALVTNNGKGSVTSCRIVPLQEGNLSDHLPVRVTFSIQCNPSKSERVDKHEGNNFPRVFWGNNEKNEVYRSLLEAKLLAHPLANISEITRREEAEHIVSELTASVNIAMHEASAEAGCVKQRHYKPRVHWCPELGLLKDRKRFWWNMWKLNDRPRAGPVFECWKSIKKEFRRISRRCLNNVLEIRNNKQSALFRERKIGTFWNQLKRKRGGKVNTTLAANDFALHFETIMQNSDKLSEFQQNVTNDVEERYRRLCSQGSFQCNVDSESIQSLIRSLPKNKSAGCDGITAEHLSYGLTDTLCSVLASIYTAILSWGAVPDVFNLGVIVPVLKKPTLDPNCPNNYRPITISSVHTKLVEGLIIPADESNDNQFGFKKGNGAEFGSAFLHDMAAVANHSRSPLFVCALDAEKCFDSIWHDGLFFKLQNKIPDSHWFLLLNWYKQLSAVIKWNGVYSHKIRVLQGTRQGSILSPVLFKYFINDMLTLVSDAKRGVTIGDEDYNSIAFADDVTLFSLTVTGLQTLIDICARYSTKWRFKFNVLKSKCIIIGSHGFSVEPKWLLYGRELECIEKHDILGVRFNCNGTCSDHIEQRLRKCRGAFYSYNEHGLCFPGLSTEAKVYLWQTVCAPTLVYGCDALYLTKEAISKLDVLQGNLIKQALGLSRRCRTSRLLKALKVPKIETMLQERQCSLLRRMMLAENCCSRFYSTLLSRFIRTGTVVPSTLLGRIVKSGAPPTEVIFGNMKKLFIKPSVPDGAVDSLVSLLFSNNYNTEGPEIALVRLLLKSF